MLRFKITLLTIFVLSTLLGLAMSNAMALLVGSAALLLNLALALASATSKASAAKDMQGSML